MKLMLANAEKCPVSAEIVGAPSNPLLPAFYSEISLGGPSFDQLLAASARGLGGLADRSIFFLHDLPYSVQRQPILWLPPDDTEEPTYDWPQAPADANQESAQSDLRLGAWVQEASERFDYLLSLPVAWDGHQAVPIKSEHVLAAAQFLSAVMAPETAAPAIVPTADGGVQLEWHQGGVDVEMLFSDCEDATLYVHDLPSDKEWEGPAIEGFSEFELGSRLSV